MNTLKKQSGFSVVELMVALVLGLILLGGVLQIYLSTKRTHDITEGLSRLQESTRFSLDMMARDIRMAGYVPCGRPQTMATLLNNASTFWWADIFDQPIQGFEGGGATLPNGVTLNGKVAESDALLILRGGSKVAAVDVYNTAAGQFEMQRSLGSAWVDDGTLMVACDPRHAAFFQVSNYSDGSPSTVTVSTGTNTPGNCSTDLGDPAPSTCTSTGSTGTVYAFDDDAQLVDYKAVIYYVADSPSGDDHSLYREYLLVDSSNNIDTRAEELLEGVDNMQLLYGIDQDDNDVAERYVQADVVADWTQVVTVRIGLLLASGEGLRDALDVDTYRVANTNIGPESGAETVTHAEDRRKRYVSSTTVSVRNPDI